MTTLSDMQRLIVEQLGADRDGRDLLVTAGAGSGKTLVLVESVLASLKAGTPLNRILAVTFTDKAASEMRNRIYERLSDDPELAPLRLRLPQAWISTIHSFCLRLLHERFETAGVDPRFRVLSDEDARLLLDDALTRVFHERYEEGRAQDGGSDPFEELVEMCGFDAGGEKLRAVVRALLGYARTSEDPGLFLSDHANRVRGHAERWEDLTWVDDYADRVASEWRRAVGLLRAVVVEIESAGKAPGKFADLLGKLEAVDPAELATPAGQAAAVARLAAEGIVADSTRLLVKLPSVPRGLGDTIGKLKAKAADAFKSEWLTEMPIDERQVLGDERQAGRLARSLIDLTRRVWETYDAAKERIGRLDFDDLQIRALRLIEETAGTDLAIRFDRVFIDEFQDVNALQDRILSLVSTPPWVFRVGDVKQSIYQFRLANPKIIRALAGRRPPVKERAAAPEDSTAWNVLLPTNYRSLPPILAIANEIAEHLFLAEEIGTEYDDQALVASGAPSSPQPPVELMLVQKEEDDAGDDAPTLEETERGAIAARIRKLITDEVMIRDPETLQPRPINYSDIAILTRARTHGPELARRLEEEGIPCSLGADASFFEAREVRDLMQILQATDNLLDDIALAASLRSPAFGWEDAELLCLRLAYPEAIHLAYALALLADRTVEDRRFSSALLPADPQERETLSGAAASLPKEPPFTTMPQRAAAALARFLDWRDTAGRIELPDLVVRILEATALARTVASLPGGLRRQANLRKFLGLARRYVPDAGHNLHRFLRWLAALDEGGAKISEAPISSESVPAVRILTIHAAKGLEFPVVLLAELGRRYQLGSKFDALVPGRRYLGVRLLDREQYLLRRPLPLRLLLDAQRDDEQAEEKRVLYVSLTRARDRLILSGACSDRTKPTEIEQRTYRVSRQAGDEIGRATAQSLLRAKPYPLSWILYTLPPIGNGAAGLPLTVHPVKPAARGEQKIPSNPMREIETALRALERVEIPGGEDPEAVRTVQTTRRVRPLPSAGSLRHARGKIWATEFKSGSDFRPVTGREEEDPDEAAVPLIPRARDEAATEGIAIHALLEQIELNGLTEANLDARIAEASEMIGGIDAAAGEVVRGGLGRLLDLPIGKALVTAGELNREVTFSLRLSMLEAARWLGDLRDEILTSEEWTEWVEPDGTGALRIRAGRASEAADPWILVQGRIDLVLRGAEGWTVLDWKSDRVNRGPAIDDRVALYEGQMEIYRRAVTHLFGAPVRAVLFFLRPGVIREI